MVDLFCFVAYILILVFSYILLDVSPVALSVFSCIVGYIYSAFIMPTRRISNIKKKMKESKMTIKNTLLIVILSSIIFGSCSALFIFIANLISKWYGDSFDSIMAGTIFTMLSLSMIPIGVICVIKMVNMKIYELSEKDKTKWEEVSDDK